MLVVSNATPTESPAAGADGGKVQRALDELADQPAGIKTRVKVNIKRKS
jgi:hypothetical protein